MNDKSHLDKKHRKSMQFRGTVCLNCGHSLDKSDVYCPRCSQINSKKQLSVFDYLSEFIGSILVYDSRLRHTLRDLLFHPGRITLNYVKGQRLKYANPFRFFLSVSIIYFLIHGMIGVFNPDDEENIVNLNTSESEISKDSLKPDRPPGLFQSSLKGDTARAKQLGIPIYLTEKNLDTLPSLERLLERSSLYLEYHYKHPKATPYLALDSLQHPKTFKNRWIYSRMVGVKKIIDNPNEFMDYISSKMPFFLFFFTPLFALFFWILYSRKKYTYMEHMIFIFHIFSFFFLTKILILFEAFFDSSYLNLLLLFLIAPLYFYFALYRFYQQSYLITLIKFFILILVFNIGFLFSILVFVAGSVAVY